MIDIALLQLLTGCRRVPIALRNEDGPREEPRPGLLCVCQNLPSFLSRQDCQSPNVKHLLLYHTDPNNEELPLILIQGRSGRGWQANLQVCPLAGRQGSRVHSGGAATPLSL